MTSCRSDFENAANTLAVVTASVVGSVHTVSDRAPRESLNMISLLAFEYTHAAPQSFCANEVAPLNTLFMFATRETSHLEMSMLNAETSMNMNMPCIHVGQRELEASNTPTIVITVTSENFYDLQLQILKY